MHYSGRLILFGLILFLLSSCSKEAAMPEGQMETALLDSVNQLRVKGCRCGNDTMPPVKALVWNSALTIAAGIHAKDMYYRNYFEHISREGSSPIQRAQSVGYLGTTVIENLARGYTTTGAVMAAWKISESHCKAMMDSASTEMGAFSYERYWVQEFGH